MILSFAEEHDVDLIVMGTHALRGWRRAILGSVTEGVLHASGCPVLTVSSLHRLPVMHGDIGITKIVCPVNFTDVAHDSLAHAASLAEVCGAEVVIVHVVEPGEETDISADEARVREWMEPELRNLCTFRELVLRGGAAERVLDCIDDIGGDLLVVGAQHKLFRDATVIGTTTERLVRFARCPVLTVTRDTRGRMKKREAEQMARA
jgi:nucleotide-binding universal stress UspA family protein